LFGGQTHLNIKNVLSNNHIYICMYRISIKQTYCRSVLFVLFLAIFREIRDLQVGG